MNTRSQDPAPEQTSRPAHESPRRHRAALTLGLVLAVAAVALICAGALAAIARSDGTYVDLGAHGSYRTDHYALATSSTNWQTQLLGWTGTVRLKVAPIGQKPIFVGVAPASAISSYLSKTGYTTIGEHTRSNHDGAAPAVSPAEAIKWTAHAEGTGTQTLRWNATDQPQIVLAMNADRSRPVRVRIASSAVTLDRMAWWVPTGTLAIGLVLLLIGIIMLRRTIRARRATLRAPGPARPAWSFHDNFRDEAKT